MMKSMVFIVVPPFSSISIIVTEVKHTPMQSKALEFLSLRCQHSCVAAIRSGSPGLELEPRQEFTLLQAVIALTESEKRLT
jgi:hypothetical protein